MRRARALDAPEDRVDSIQRAEEERSVLKINCSLEGAE